MLPFPVPSPIEVGRICQVQLSSLSDPLISCHAKQRVTEGGREGGSQKLDVAAAAVKNQRHKTEDRGRETSDFKIDVLTFRPRASIFVQTVVIEGNPRDQVRVAS